MAEITFDGYVQERDGKRLRVSEEHRRKNQNGEWVNAGYTDYTVWLRREDQQPEVQKGAIVLVQGRFQTGKHESKGREFLNLNVNASSVGVVRLTPKYEGAQSAQPVRDTGWGDQSQAWGEPAPTGYEDNPPF